MEWQRRWKLDLPGNTTGPIVYDATTSSLFVADGWGVANAALTVRRVDVANGRVLASVRTKASIRAISRADEDSIYLLGTKALFVHDARTLERTHAFEQRVPRYANGVVTLEPGWALLAAPEAIQAYEVATGKSRRLFKHRAAALQRAGQNVRAVLDDGRVVAGVATLAEIASFGAPTFEAAFHPTRELVAALVGVRGSPDTPDGVPQAVSATESAELLLLDLGTGRVGRSTLPLAAHTVGFVGDTIVVARADGLKPHVARAIVPGDTAECELSFSRTTIDGVLAGIVEQVGVATFTPPRSAAPGTLALYSI